MFRMSPFIWLMVLFKLMFTLSLLIAIYSGATRARFARPWAEPHSLVNLPIPENL